MGEESKHLDPFVMSLNHGETFGVFNRHGDISRIGDTSQGVFFGGARHLSKLELTLNGKKPSLLSSTIREDNDSLTADLANEEFQSGDSAIRANTIHIKKEEYIRNDSFVKKLFLRNYNDSEAPAKIEVLFDADFSDVFELRGFETERKKEECRGTCHEGKSLVYDYVGRDGHKRKTTIVLEEGEGRFFGNGLVMDLVLPPKELVSITLLVNFHSEEPGIKGRSVPVEALRDGVPVIETDNPHFNHWIKRSALDLLALFANYEGIIYPMAGVPWYNTPFGRDGLITAFQTLFAAPFIAKNVLEFLSSYQATTEDRMSESEPGKILHELRKGELSNIGALPFKKYYGSVDSTFLWIWLFELYYERTGDDELLEKLWPSFELACEWTVNTSDRSKEGFYTYYKRNPEGLDNQCWKDSWDSISHKDGSLAKGALAVSEVQGYAYRAFIAASRLYRTKGDMVKEREFSRRASDLKEKFNKSFWVEELGFYALALDGEGRPCAVKSSNIGQCFATGILDKDKVERCAKELLRDELYSGWGVRTLGHSEARYNPMSYHNGSIWPHDNSLIAYGLKREGQSREFHTLLIGMYSAARQFELIRLPELFCGFSRVTHEAPTLYPVSCSPQAWASGVVFLLIHSMLGIRIHAKEKSLCFDCPELPVYLNRLTIKKLIIGGEVFSFTVRRAGQQDATIEMSERPKNWSVSILK